MVGPGGCIDSEGHVPLRSVQGMHWQRRTSTPTEDPGDCIGSKGQVPLKRVQGVALTVMDKYPNGRSRGLHWQRKTSTPNGRSREWY